MFVPKVIKVVTAKWTQTHYINPKNFWYLLTITSLMHLKNYSLYKSFKEGKPSIFTFIDPFISNYHIHINRLSIYIHAAMYASILILLLLYLCTLWLFIIVNIAMLLQLWQLELVRGWRMEMFNSRKDVLSRCFG